MPQPLTIEERDEVGNLAAECGDADKLRAYLAELVRLRALASICRRHHNRLPRLVLRVLDARVPKLSSGQEWARVVADPDMDLRAEGAPRLL